MSEANLAQCPFCGGGSTSIRENGRVWTGMKWSTPVSVSVIHHCVAVDGQPSRALEFVGRDIESAIAAWNRRADPQQRKPLSEDRAMRIVMEACEQAGAIITTNAAVIAARAVERAHNITEDANG